MMVIDYPQPEFSIKQQEGRPYIFDAIRKTWLLLTEEEWVRQNFIQYLVVKLNFPLALIAVEKKIVVNGLSKRFDVLVYNNNHMPWMLVECKAPDVVLNDAALQQVLRYNLSVPVRYLVITNGNQTYGWEKSGNNVLLLQQLPAWSQ